MMVAVKTGKTSPEELFHSVNNQLTIVMAHAEMLAYEGGSEQALARCREIKRAASNINRLLQALMIEDKLKGALHELEVR